MDVLKNKSYKDYAILSRYSPFPFYYNIVDKKYVYGTVSHLDTRSDYTMHKVRYGETYDTIALMYYNNPTYFWVICDFNRIIDCFSAPKVGKMLKIPVISALQFE